MDTFFHVFEAWITLSCNGKPPHPGTVWDKTAILRDFHYFELDFKTNQKYSVTALSCFMYHFL
jgi:hypothetical protein